MIRMWSILHLSHNDSPSAMAEAQLRGKLAPLSQTEHSSCPQVTWVTQSSSLQEQAQQRQSYTQSLRPSHKAAEESPEISIWKLLWSAWPFPRQEENSNHQINSRLHPRSSPHTTQTTLCPREYRTLLSLTRAVRFFLKQQQARLLIRVQSPSADFSELCLFKRQDSGISHVILEVEKSRVSQILVTSREVPGSVTAGFPQTPLWAVLGQGELMRCSSLIWLPVKYDNPHLNYTFIPTGN